MPACVRAWRERRCPELPPLAAHPAAASAGVTKIAVINFQGAVAQTNEGQRNFSELQKKFDPKRTQLKSLQDKIDSDKKQLQASGDKLSDAERQARLKSIDDEEKEYQRTGEDASNDFQQEMQQTYAQLAEKVYGTAPVLRRAERLHRRAGRRGQPAAGPYRPLGKQEHRYHRSRDSGLQREVRYPCPNLRSVSASSGSDALQRASCARILLPPSVTSSRRNRNFAERAPSLGALAFWFAPAGRDSGQEPCPELWKKMWNTGSPLARIPMRKCCIEVMPLQRYLSYPVDS